MTVLIGAIVTYFSNYLQSEREHKLARVLERQAAIQKMADAFAGWTANASQLRVGMASFMPAEHLVEIKKKYDESVITLDTFFFEQSLTYIRVLPFDADSEDAHEFAARYSDYFNERIFPIVIAVNQCTIYMYDRRVSNATITDSEWGTCPDQSSIDARYIGMPPDLRGRVIEFENCSSAYLILLYIMSRIDTDDRRWSEKDLVADANRGFSDLVDRRCSVKLRQPIIK